MLFSISNVEVQWASRVAVLSLIGERKRRVGPTAADYAACVCGTIVSIDAYSVVDDGLKRDGICLLLALVPVSPYQACDIFVADSKVCSSIRGAPDSLLREIQCNEPNSRWPKLVLS